MAQTGAVGAGGDMAHSDEREILFRGGTVGDLADCQLDRKKNTYSVLGLKGLHLLEDSE